METIINTFHLDWKLMLAQLINFGIVAFVLWFFVFKPLSKKMHDRTNKIEQSLADAKEVAEKLQKAQAERDKIIKLARQNALKISEEAAKQLAAEKKQAMAETKQQLQQLVLENKKDITAEKQKMWLELKNDVADLVILTTNKILAKVVDKKINQSLIDEALSEINKSKTAPHADKLPKQNT